MALRGRGGDFPLRFYGGYSTAYGATASASDAAHTSRRGSPLTRPTGKLCAQ